MMSSVIQLHVLFCVLGKNDKLIRNNINYISGHVVTMDCVERIIRKSSEEDMICPMTGVKLKESDIIPLVRVCY